MARKIEIGFDRYFKRPWMDYYFNLMAAGTDPKQVRELFLDFLMKEAGRRHGGGHWNLCEKDERNLSNPIPPNEEYKAFQSFLGRMDELRAEFGDEGFIIFHYAHYEPTHLLSLAEKYKDRSASLIDRVDYLNQRMVVSPDLVINTVERIQGQERDVVVVSLTASGEEHIKAEKDFLMMPNRMNVSFTRPRTKLIVVGGILHFSVYTFPTLTDASY